MSFPLMANTNAANMAEQSGANTDARESQARVDKLDDEAQNLLNEYAQVLSRTENMRIYNTQLERYIESQKQEMVSIKAQIEQLAETNHGITPLMLKMLSTLETFVTMDSPFLQKERSERITGLKEMMNRADVSTSEKYRRILEAYQIENEYGRTIEVYRDTFTANGRDMTVDFLRVGRVSLMYQTLDAKEQAYWDAAQMKWIELPGSFSRSIRDGIRIARQQAAPDLIKVPVLGPQRL